MAWIGTFKELLQVKSVPGSVADNANWQLCLDVYLLVLNLALTLRSPVNGQDRAGIVIYLEMLDHAISRDWLHFFNYPKPESLKPLNFSGT